MGQSILKAILYSLGTFIFGQIKGQRQLKSLTVWEVNLKNSSYDILFTRR